MSKKLNLSSALGFFLIGIFSANISQAQTYTNLYWYPTNALGGTGSWSTSGALWSTNSTGGGTLQAPLTSTSNIYNFSGTAGTVSGSSGLTVGGINWLTTGYTYSSGANRTYVGTDATATGTNTVYIANNANLNITGTGITFDALSMTGGTGATVTLTNAAAATTTVIFGTSSAKGGRTNSVNTIINGAGTIILGSTAATSGFTQAGNIVNNSTGVFVLTNGGSGTVAVSGVVSGTGGLLVNSTSTGKVVLSGSDNSFGGGVTLGGSSTLYLNKFGMSGLNSSLGTNGTITVGLAGQNSGNGTLRWTGTASETSDKVINLNSSTNGVTILANGATNASLTLNGNINSTAAGAKTLNFGGYDSNTLILNGVINENGGSNSVVIGNNNNVTVALGNTNNSFSGAITITNSLGGRATTLSTANIGNADANSALGKNGTINLGSTNASALTTLKYTGTGETSDKVINLAGTIGGAILDQSGTGNLKFTSAMTATGVGAKAITLQGSSAGTGELAGAISDLGGNVISLNKYGSGDWTLSGNNSYSGLTTVKDAGSLLKLMNTGALSVKTSLAGDSTLGTTGTIEFGAGGNYTANSYGTASSAGNNMFFTNSSGSAVTLTFTNANNYITTSGSGGRTLSNSVTNLNLDFDGNIEIGSTNISTTAFKGAGNFNVDGNLLDTGANGERTLLKDGEGTLTLRGSGNNYRGSTLVSNGKLDLYGSVTASTNITVSTVPTDGAVSAASTTRTATATLDVKSGATLLNNSTTTVYSGGNLIVNGTAGSVVLESNGLLGGSGAVGNVELKSGSLLNPGNSPGLLTAASSSWAAGSTYNWEIDQATGGTAGVNWDVFSVVGALDLSALSSTAQMNLVLNSLPSMDDFSSTAAYSWVIAQAGSFIGTGLADGTNVTSLFNIDAADFNSGVGPNGGFKVEVGTDANNLRTLNLMAIPEPSTGSLMMFGLSGLVLTRLLRRKVS